MIKYLTILLFFIPLFIAAGVNAQQQSTRQLTKMRFTQFTGGVIVLKACLDVYKDSLSFILDTGSGGISLDSTTVQELGLQPSAPERLIRGIGGTRKVGFIKNHTLNLNGLVVDSLNFHVVDYEILSSLYGEKIDGIIGYSILSRYIVKINYNDSTISFWSNGNIRYPRGGFLLKPNISALPLLSATVDDAKSANFNYLFDIGAGLTVLFSKSYVRDSSFLKSGRKQYIKQGEGLGGKVEMFYSYMKELKIGRYKFKNVPINIFDDKYNVTSYPQLGGLVGNEIFRRFNCILNYNKKEIHLIPNKHFSDPFDYAYSGIEIYWVEGKAIAGDIPKGSPAEAAGFKMGDEILAVNNKFGMHLNDLKQVLQSTYGEVKVIIRRNEELQVLRMNVINIFKKK